MNEENLDHHYTRHERSRSSRREDERLPWRKSKRYMIPVLMMMMAALHSYTARLTGRDWAVLDMSRLPLSTCLSQSRHQQASHVKCRSKSRERKVKSMDSATDTLDSEDLDTSVQAALLDAAQKASPTRSAVELSLDEDKVCCGFQSLGHITALHLKSSGIRLLCVPSMCSGALGVFLLDLLLWHVLLGHLSEPFIIVLLPALSKGRLFVRSVRGASV